MTGRSKNIEKRDTFSSGKLMNVSKSETETSRKVQYSNNNLVEIYLKLYDAHVSYADLIMIPSDHPVIYYYTSDSCCLVVALTYCRGAEDGPQTLLQSSQ